MKTHKATSKRFWLSGSGKLRRRKSGQDHFNSRDSQKTSNRKRKGEIVTENNPRLRELIPFK